MAMVGAFLGGPGSVIPVGSGLLRLSWATGDGQNTQVSFVISGSVQETVQSDSNGFAETILPVGDYNVSVSHGGEYNGAEPKTVTVKSRELAEVSWFATPLDKQPSVFESGVKSPTAEYYVKKDGTVVASGIGWTETMVFDLTPGDYTLTLSIFNDTVDYSFTVQNNTINQYDTSSLFCTIGISFNSPMVTITYNGVQAYSGNGIRALDLVVLRKTQSRTIAATSENPPTFSGVSTSPIYTVSVPSKAVTPNAQSLAVSITSVRVGVVTIITSSGSIVVPNAMYKLLVIGGGGGGGGGNTRTGSTLYSGGGGGGGNAILEDTVLSGSYNITIGSGGAGGELNSYGRTGARTSFGSKYSYGGNGGYYSGDGGLGGSGGGAGYGGDGGNGSMFGGGGYRGSGGTYGGDGGNTADRNGDDGVAGPVFDISSDYSGGKQGYDYTYLRETGYGGGGGYAAAGGDAGDSYVSNRDGGNGGGGGIAGGDGGRGGDSTNTNSVSVVDCGEPGHGYGAGGGGCARWYSTYGKCPGGGGGGGFGSNVVAGSAGGTNGGDGAPGCVVLQWIGDSA